MSKKDIQVAILLLASGSCFTFLNVRGWIIVAAVLIKICAKVQQTKRRIVETRIAAIHCIVEKNILPVLQTFTYFVIQSTFKINRMITQNKRLAGIIGLVAFLLTIPAIAMQFTNEVNWSASDFVVAGALLLSTGLIIELALRKIKKMPYRLITAAVILFIAFLIWAELAVGIFGTPWAGQ